MGMGSMAANTLAGSAMGAGGMAATSLAAGSMAAGGMAAQSLAAGTSAAGNMVANGVNTVGSMGAANAGGVHVAGPNGGEFTAAGIRGARVQAGGIHTGNGVIINGGAGPGVPVDPGFGVQPGVPMDPGFGVQPGVPGAGGASCVGGPGAACGGFGVCCEPAGAMVTNTGWAYVGEGRGDFAAMPSYNYVGQGVGAYTKEVTTVSYGWKLRPCCVALLLLGLLLPLLWLLLPRGDGGTSSVPEPQIPVVQPAPTPIGVCTVFGDPHVLTFDHKRADYYTPGEYWIVKSSTISIQGRYLPTKMTSGLGVTKILAVGGPLLKGNKLFVSSTSATWNDQPILTGFPSTYSVPGVISMEYNDQGQTLQKGRAGMQLHVVHIKIEDGSPEGIVIQINRWTKDSEGHYINVRITM
eukprot:CAMPEP_0197876058 /NCGR_PEP_ID=MMETSP1439-20131203/5141_1 /TAXON_ID=66791 /ORGANISM="Gonyaulax spinifera, Strain CCMP409" /LENGTH=408 /DNA_ID=CAMNT_0043495327 /DNA_START=11 /DNA_END=1234 /DNA_ORIENTATION=+